MGGGHDHTLPLLKLKRTEYHSQKEGGKVAMASSSSPLGKWRWGGHGHTPLPPKRKVGEAIVAFPPSFWKWYEDDHGHSSTLGHEERGRVHGSLPSSLLGEGWVVAMTTLFHFSSSEGQITTPRRKMGRWKMAMASSSSPPGDPPSLF